MNKYLAGNEKGRVRFAKIPYTTSTEFIPRAALRPPTDPIERLKKFHRNEKKYNQHAEQRETNIMKNSKPHPSQQQQHSGVESIEPIFHQFHSSKDHNFKSPSTVWNINTERAAELKNLLEERERYFNGEMDEIYYKAGPNRNPMPTPTNLRFRTARSTLSSRQDTSVQANKNSTESLDSISEISLDPFSRDTKFRRQIENVSEMFEELFHSDEYVDDECDREK